MRRSKRNTIRFANSSRGAYQYLEIISDRLIPYIQLLRRLGVSDRTRTCASVRWSGTIWDADYSEAPCVLDAFITQLGDIFISASLYDGYGTEDNPLGVFIRCFDAPLSYYESQLIVTKPDDIGMSILISVK